MLILSSWLISGWISLSFSIQLWKTLVLFSLFLRQKKLVVCFASSCTISPCLKFSQGFYWKKKSVLTSTLLYCSKSMQHSARSSWVSQLQIGICFIIYSLTSQCVWLWKKTSLYNYYHFWISNDWRTQKACKSCYYGQRDEYLLGHLVTGSYICIQKNLNSPYLNWWKHDNSLWQLRVCSGLQSIVILVVILIQRMSMAAFCLALMAELSFKRQINRVTQCYRSNYKVLILSS